MAPPINKTELRTISTLMESLNYGINALGQVPRRQRNMPPILSLRRYESTQTREETLTKLNNGVLPEAFILTTFSGISPPPTARINNSAAQKGTRVGIGDTGQKHMVRQVELELQLNSVLYASDLEYGLNYAAMVCEHNAVAGVLKLDAISLPIDVTISKTFSITDPVSGAESSNFLDRMHQLSFSFVLYTRAATIEASPLMQSFVFETRMGDGNVEIKTRNFTDSSDWGL